MAPSNDKPKKSELLRRWIDFVFGFENKRGDVLDSWIYSADGLSLPRRIYEHVQRKWRLARFRRWNCPPRICRSGMLSDRRLYLRLMRERLAITTCAAPFGKIFFFRVASYTSGTGPSLAIIAALAFFYGVMRLLIIPSA